MIRINGCSLRGEDRWIYFAYSSFPVPVSPTISTLESTLATLFARYKSFTEASSSAIMSCEEINSSRIRSISSRYFFASLSDSPSRTFSRSISSKSRLVLTTMTSSPFAKTGRLVLQETLPLRGRNCSFVMLTPLFSTSSVVDSERTVPTISRTLRPKTSSRFVPLRASQALFTLRISPRLFVTKSVSGYPSEICSS